MIKERVGGWLDRELDHGMILQRGDELIEFLVSRSSKVFVIEVSPTSENLAKLVFDEAKVLLADSGVTVTRVRCHETPTSHADYP